MRPRQAIEALASFEETRTDKRSRMVFVVDSDDPTLNEYPSDYTYVAPPLGCMGAAMAYSLPGVIGDATVVGMIGDDNRFRTRGWDGAFSKWLAARPGIVYGDDLYQSERKPTSWWVSRPIVDEFGMALPTLRHLYMDDFWQTLGQDTRSIRYMPEVVIEHLHPDAGKAPVDEIYIRGSAPASPNATLDRQTFERWRASPERRQASARLREILADIRPREVNVLADYHHPALYESLALLFEDRFGWNLYRPRGAEWWDQGYWSFINLGMSLDWTDFLGVGRDWKDTGLYGELPGEQYPRPMKGVSLWEARATTWDYVLTSVWENQQGFARFAKESGAQFVHQIGNAAHAVDWRLPAKYMISATLDARKQPAVVYHQEFDLKTFKYQKPGRNRRVSNFVLRFDWQTEAYAQFVQARGLAPDFQWSDYGSLYGELVKQTDVAKAMSEAAFIWHDKPIGDGFGHAIHNAAAVGRPIVGHARHYNGRLAEPFWRDGETCIDLDRHPVPEAVELMREIMSVPSRHRRMCEAMYETFLATVDFEEDARKVRSLLEPQ